MNDTQSEILEIVNRETEAWSTKDVSRLLSCFHSDMVWVWPKKSTSHNPIDWELPLGKFDQRRWRAAYESMFNEFELIHNRREVRKVEISEEQDGGFAVVDVDTLWRNKQGEEKHWFGRTGKTYVKTDQGWKMIAQTGILTY